MEYQKYHLVGLKCPILSMPAISNEFKRLVNSVLGQPLEMCLGVDYIGLGLRAWAKKAGLEHFDFECINFLETNRPNKGTLS